MNDEHSGPFNKYEDCHDTEDLADFLRPDVAPSAGVAPASEPRGYMDKLADELMRHSDNCDIRTKGGICSCHVDWTEPPVALPSVPESAEEIAERHCCDAQFELDAIKQHFSALGLTKTISRSANVVEHVWKNTRAESVEARLASVRGWLERNKYVLSLADYNELTALLAQLPKAAQGG